MKQASKKSTALKAEQPPASPTADNALDAALAEAQDQVEAMTGDWRTPARFRFLDQRYGVLRENQRPAIQLFGSLADDAFCNELWRLNCGEYDAYIIAQGVGPRLPATAAVNQDDIAEARVIFADADDHDPIAEFHIAPTFRLRRENSPRHFWLGWRVEDMPVGKIRETQQRIAQRYGTDPTVCDPARIIRLAGFTSHKRPEKTRYTFERMPGKSTRYSDHAKALPKIERAQIEKGDGGEDYISEKRLRLALASINPECGKPGEACRNKWIATLGAIMDAKVGRDEKTYMENFDKFDLADEWSSGALGGSDAPANYEGFDDVASTMENLSRAGDRERAGIGSIIRAARAAGMDAGQHEQLRKAEPFTHPTLVAKPYLATKDGEPAAAANDSRPRRHFQFYSREEMEHIEPPEWLIQDFLPQGSYTMLAAAQDAFKTFVAIDAALTIATGVAGGVWPTVKNSSPVLFAAGEGRSQVKKRVAAWELTHLEGRRAKDFVLAGPVPPVSEEGLWQAFIDGALEMQPKGYSLVVIDTVGRSMQGLNENAQEHASRFTKLVEKLQSELAIGNVNCAVLALHHTGHDAVERPRGSSVFGADADTIVRLDRAGKAYLVTLTMLKQKDAPEWEKPRMAMLREVQLPDGNKSLVAVKPTDAEAVKATAATTEAAKAGRRRANQYARPDPAATTLLDNVVIAVLASNKMRAWSTSDLAEALAMRAELGDISSETLKRRTLKDLREDKSTRANKVYDPMLKRWRHRA